MGKTLKSYADWRLRESMLEFDFYRRKLERLLLTMFTWENLPDGISERYLERSLYETGLVIFYKSNSGFTKGSFVIAKATPIGYNAYNEPTGFRAYSDNGIINEMVKACDCVPIWNDYQRMGNISNVNYYAKRISNIEKTIDINLEQLKTPTIVTCPEGQKESVKAVFAKKTNGEPLILVDEDFMSTNSIKVFDLKATNHIPQLSESKREIISDALTFFGVNNVPVSKKERLIVSESEQNDEQIWLNTNVMYRPRALAVKEINEKFGLSITLSLSNDLRANVENLKGESNE